MIETKVNPGQQFIPQFRTAGECGIIVEFGDQIDLAINNAALAFDKGLAALAIDGIIETTPTIRSVLVQFNPLQLAPDALIKRLTELLDSRDWLSEPPPPGRKLWTVPAVYGGEYGPDLEEVANMTGLSEDEVIISHSSTIQRVLMVGFAPGQTYLGLLDENWNLPRLEKINPQIPAGAITVAIRQTVFFPDASPTGWRSIGRSPFRSFRPHSSEPFPFRAGDEIRFEVVDASQFNNLAAQVEAGEMIARQEEII